MNLKFLKNVSRLLVRLTEFWFLTSFMSYIIPKKVNLYSPPEFIWSRILKIRQTSTQETHFERYCQEFQVSWCTTDWQKCIFLKVFFFFSRTKTTLLTVFWIISVQAIYIFIFIRLWFVTESFQFQFDEFINLN